MTTWKTTYISAVVHCAGDNPIINDHSTTVTICDEAGGAFVSLTDCEGTTIKLDPDEFEIVANVARGMIENFEDKPRTPISVVNEAFNKAEAIFSSLKSEMLEANADPNQPYVTEWFDGMRDSLSAVAEANITPRTAADDRWHKSARDLLAVIHRDGGQHTGEVGTVQSCKDAEAVVHALMLDSTMLDSAMATDDAKIVTCLFRYIDRMNDVCDEDPADTILREFVADVMPFINERISKAWPQKKTQQRR